nr:anthranilate phosphoribosyltransferase [Flexivirga meconopsidis]
MTAGRTLSADLADAAFAELLDKSSEADTAIFLTALAHKGTHVDELLAALRALQDRAIAPADAPSCIDIVGTGGDHSGSVNVSTISAILASAVGSTVAKVGNRAATSRCGSADLLEGLGVPTDYGPHIADRLRRHHFAFLFSRAVHPSLDRLASVRRSLGFPTIFNQLGPLGNPVPLAGAIIGVTTPSDQELLAEAVSRLGRVNTWIVRGADGMDELTTTGVARVLTVSTGRSDRFVLDPAEWGMAPATIGELAGGNLATNMVLTRNALAGKGSHAIRQTCALNAAAALHVGGRGDLDTCLSLVSDAIASGAAIDQLRRLSQPSTDCPEENVTCISTR